LIQFQDHVIIKGGVCMWIKDAEAKQTKTNRKQLS